MAIANDADTSTASGQKAFIDMVSVVFSSTADEALGAFVKLRSFMKADTKIEGLYQSAQLGILASGENEVFEQTSRSVLKWDIGAVVRSVVMPLAGGYLGAGIAAALGATGAVPALIGLLVGAIILLCLAPGTWQMLKKRITATVEGISGPTER